jgi:hypothetical protein
MSLRPIRLAAGLLVTSLAFGVAPAAPALADGIAVPPARHHVRHQVRHHVWHAPRVVERIRVVNRIVPVDRVRVVERVVPQIVYVPQPVPQYTSACGGCGGHVAYAPPPPPPVQYRSSGSCGGCGYGVAQTGTYYSGAGYVGTQQYADDEEYAPAYAPGYSTGYSTGYIGGGYIRPRLRFSTRFVGNRVGFRRGFSNRSFYGRRTARFR